ncbi:MAG: prepilin-type N-terminal cleavage/methylation domain-containing protein [Candidatus Omnitrophica bacterium]|nr:prepilin-type N-terminal cleavage/methylation domain-containing protein [Candidatus Omnitrophota bacterium]MBU4590296.1 prepilin-type N-terminal cleavage/methylation domain-containing protein [Candidatus Omnitrophota bacterium]
MTKRGFTLLEVLIVVIIIGILAAIAMPQYMSTLEKARSGEAMTNIGTIRTSLDRYWYEKLALPSNNDFSVLDIADPNDQNQRMWNYYFTDGGTDATTRKYTVTAYRYKNATEDTNTYVIWTQTDNNTGAITKSSNIGG